MSGNADWRERVALRAIDNQITTQLGLLGFNPSQRSKLGVAEVQRESALDRLIAQRQNPRT